MARRRPRKPVGAIYYPVPPAARQGPVADDPGPASYIPASICPRPSTRHCGWRPFGRGAKSTTSSWRGLRWHSGNGSGGVEGPFFEGVDLPRPFGGFAYISGAMLFDLQLLGKPDAAGNADVIENRTLAAASVEEAARAARGIVLNTPVRGVYGFRLIRNGLEVFHWFIGQEGV